MSRRIILLGASNLTMGLPRLVRAFAAGFDGPLEICAALGHGRSYGMWSRVLYRELPGIVDCGLWPALATSSEQPDKTLGLITDVGNDLLYGAEVSQIAEWVETCVTRMKGDDADVVLTSLPTDCVDRLGPWRYYPIRKLLFPNSRISLEEIRRRAHELNELVLELGRQHGATVVELPGKLYSFDPIHFRHPRRSEAWRRILCGWSEFPPETPTHLASPAAWFRLSRIQPELRRVFGRERRTDQPVFDRGRVKVSLY